MHTSHDPTMGKRPLQQVVLLVAAVAYLAVAGILLLNFRASNPQALAKTDANSAWLSWNPLFWKTRAYYALYTREPKPEQAVEASKRVLAINPVDREAWENLIDAYTQLAETGKLEAALRAAARALPHSPVPNWRLANYLVLQGRTEEALPYLRTAAASAPDLRHSVYALAWKLLDDGDAVMRTVVPDSLDARKAYAEFLLYQSKLSEAFQVWSVLKTEREASVAELGGEIARRLMEGGLPQQASNVWDDVLAAQGKAWTRPAGEVITNGDFESPITDKGLGWRIFSKPEFETVQDSSTAQNGSASLRILFTNAGNVDAVAGGQLIALEPQQDYYFRGYIKTEKLTSNSGLRFLLHISSADGSNAIELTTPSLTGTHGWTAQELCFRTGPQSRAAMLQLRRPPDTGLLNVPLTGAVWVDNVTLTKATRQAACANLR